MKTVKPRQTHSAEFKAKVGLEAVQGVKSVHEIAQAHGVHPVLVGKWKKEIQARAKGIFETKRGPAPAPEHEDPERMQCKIGKMQMEIDWLKKKLGINP